MLLRFVLLAAFLTCACAHRHVTVNTTAGPIVGEVRAGSRTFLGVPFAAPPVGDLRLRAPQPVTPWTKPRNCHDLLFVETHLCTSNDRTPNGTHLGQEDCLYHHVYTPDPLPREPLPVMIWFFGGAYSLGDGYEFHLYDGAKLAQKHNVMVVSPNYRLEALGFLAHEALQREDPNHSTGNMALLDQRAVMQWVQDNAAFFGGDPNRVTLFGQSAGAFSISWHLASQQSWPLFHRVVMESTSFSGQEFFQPLEIATQFGDEYARGLGCDFDKLGSDAAFLKCLRALPAKDVIVEPLTRGHNQTLPFLFPAMPWSGVIDMSDAGLSMAPTAAIQAGKFHKVPTIVGSNHDEGSIFLKPMSQTVPNQSYPFSEHSFKNVLNHFINESSVDAAVALYPEANYSMVDIQAASILRDFFFTCDTFRNAGYMAAQGVPVWVYRFTFKFGGPLYDKFGVFHMSELNFVWGNKFPPLVGKWDLDHDAMSATFQNYWTSLAHTGDPNAQSLSPSPPFWPRYNDTDHVAMILDVPSVPTQDLNVESYCSFWDAVQQRPNQPGSQ